MLGHAFDSEKFKCVHSWHTEQALKKKKIKKKEKKRTEKTQYIAA